MPEPHAQLLHDYLRAVRRLARRRGVVAVVSDLVAVGLGAVAAVGALVAWSLRGDLGVLGLLVVALAVGSLTALRLRALAARTRSPLAVARAISRARGALRSHASPAERERDAGLRHELLGATELWQASELGRPDEQRSPELAAAYVRRIGAATLDLDPDLALPRPRRWPRILALVLSAGALAGLAVSAPGQRGFGLLFAAEDGRPPPPPRPVWSALELELDYPEHTRRPDRRVPNPSGALRVPAGTRITVDMDIAEPAEAARLVLIHDAVELAEAPEPEVHELEAVGGEDSRRWRGSFTVRGAGVWVVALLDDAGDPDDPGALAVAERRSKPMRVELEPDAPPEVELLPLPESQREANETDRIDLRFSARDDFGVVEAELVYEIGPIGDRKRLRLPAGEAPGGAARSWRHRYSWDLSAIPLEDRGEVSYWIEVRDNDPGLGLVGLDDGPGKVSASARQQLLVHDEEAEHAENIRNLQEIRDAAVDLLAARLTTEAFEGLGEEIWLPRKLERARDIRDASAALLTMIAGAVDDLAMDTMVGERELMTLAGIHERLLELHRKEAELHEDVPPGAEFEDSAEVAKLLRKLGKHNEKQRAQLEDEIIRLDDLVDEQIIERIEALVARLQVSQQKLVEKLEQLAAGDESVRPEIEQLEQRIREDLRKVQEARAALRKEVGDEWMNLDAFKAMEARMQSQALLEQLRRGDVDGALEQAREGLEAIRNMREQVQKNAAEPDAPQLSEEERQRMKMLRELSRLQDEQTGLRSETRRLREKWRESVGQQQADERATKRAKQQAEELREELEDINDARLSREGRKAWEDAREALEKLEAAKQDKAGQSRQLELFEAARDAAEALERAKAGSKASEAEGESIRKLAKQAERLRRELREPLPDPDDVLDPDSARRLRELGERQQTLRERSDRLLEDPAAEILPDEGREGMRGADQGMRQAHDALDGAALDGALRGEERAWQGLQRAIDSLRESSPPPPPQSSAGDASTEAERDRSLRDQVVEAMREGDREGFDEDTKRYYEELLR